MRRYWRDDWLVTHLVSDHSGGQRTFLSARTFHLGVYRK